MTAAGTDLAAFGSSLRTDQPRVARSELALRHLVFSPSITMWAVFGHRAHFYGG
jgi:hypothetical protein